MAVTHEIIAGIGDIKAVIFECRKCGERATITYANGGTVRNVFCRACSKSSSQELGLVDMLESMRATGGSSAFRVSLEFEDSNHV
jgi:hypothetical protein